MPSILPAAAPLGVYSEIIRNLGSISAILAFTPYDAQAALTLLMAALVNSSSSCA